MVLLISSRTNSLPIWSKEKASDVPRKQDLDSWSASKTLATFPSKVSHSLPIKVGGSAFSSLTTFEKGLQKSSNAVPLANQILRTKLDQGIE